MKNKPDSKICCLAGNAKINLLILVNNENFYLELTLDALLGHEMIDDIS